MTVVVDRPKKVLPDSITVTGSSLFLKPNDTRTRIHSWMLMHGIKPEECAEFTLVLDPLPLRARFVLYDRNVAGERYLIAGRPASFMETRKIYSIPGWAYNWIADGYYEDKPL